MGKLNIRIYPDKILQSKAWPVGAITENERKLAYDMIETMRDANGVGLAAPQTGISKRIIVVEDVENHRSALALVNPGITEKNGRSSFCEACLSVPGVSGDVVRPESVVVEALNLDGKPIKIETGGFLARILQHEIDHLDGILFIDRLGFLRRKKVVKQISKKICMEL